ncbi:MAG: hypothetical protein COX57_10095 [Alphaproteobacteria bacterium CG_4_10_14_0_2_um_filter_63_37]|nr:MAG: hypothetical protein AUJ55_04120 [Proteobacteria bacterium CG1_02_64_396]PJA24131.1 MAG: hypothetical protein COX57_10095 [Alphaproteobacteria bacterium CG_4_10_14_0_2_um_filter_63_37]
MWIADPQALREALLSLQGEAIALDTEFVRERTYFPTPGLVQLADIAGQVYLVDPLELTDWSPFCDALAAEERTFWIHSGSQDMEILHLLCGRLPAQVIDTQVAAAFAGMGEQIGAAKMFETLLDTTLPPEATRSDWTQRPLSDVQLEYARADVRQLVEVGYLLRDKVGEARWPWVVAASRERLLDKTPFQIDGDTLLQRFKPGVWLKPKERFRARALLVWREEIAQRKNRPRSHVLADPALTGASRDEPVLPKGRYRDVVMALLETIPPDGALMVAGKPTAAVAAEHNRIWKCLRVLAEELELPLSLIASSRDALSWARHLVEGAPAPRLLQGWRWEALGREATRRLSLPPSEEPSVVESAEAVVSSCPI